MGKTSNTNAQIGTPAPNLQLLNQDEEVVELADLWREKPLVLYFYPKNETPGCVREACAFRDSYEDFLAAGAQVVGVSADSPASHRAFRENRRLPFPLLSDQDGAAQRAFGVEGSLMGLLPGRETFVIDTEGIVRHRFASQFRVDSHIEEAKQVIEALGK